MRMAIIAVLIAQLSNATAGEIRLVELKGTLRGVPSKTPIRADATESCCFACDSVCNAKCDGTRCKDSSCCVYTNDTSMTDQKGHFMLFLEPGIYRVTARIGNTERILFPRIVLKSDRDLGDMTLDK